MPGARRCCRRRAGAPTCATRAPVGHRGWPSLERANRRKGAPQHALRRCDTAHLAVVERAPALRAGRALGLSPAGGRRENRWVEGCSCAPPAPDAQCGTGPSRVRGERGYRAGSGAARAAPRRRFLDRSAPHRPGSLLRVGHRLRRFAGACGRCPRAQGDLGASGSHRAVAPARVSPPQSPGRS